MGLRLMGWDQLGEDHASFLVAIALTVDLLNTLESVPDQLGGILGGDGGWERHAVGIVGPALAMISFTYMRSEVDCILRTSPLVLSFSRGATRYAVCDITLLPDTREKGLLGTLPQRVPTCRCRWWIRSNDAMRCFARWSRMQPPDAGYCVACCVRCHSR